MHEKNLGLDEALITVNKSSIDGGESPLDVYYQIDECFGCPLEKLKTLPGGKAAHLSDFVIGTKYKFQLELRNLNGGNTSSEPICRFENLSLNDHGHYKIDITTSHQHQHQTSKLSLQTTGSGFNCSFQTLEKGTCSLCPLAILLCLIFVLTGGEKLYSKFINRKTRRSKTTVSSIKNNNNKATPLVESPSSIQNNNNNNNNNNGTNNADQQVAVPVAGEQLEHELAIASGGGEQQQQTIAIATGQPINDNDDHQSPPTNQNISSTKNHRVESLDTFRGLTITGMILVNHGGAGYAILQHKAWDGITLADFVFPFFIFSMGASIAISTKSMVKRRGKTFIQILIKIFRRSCLLMALGLCLNSKWLNETSSLNELRLTGVLQRFSISYLIVAIMYSIEMTVNKWIKAQSLYRLPGLISKIARVLFELLTAINYLAIYLYVTFYFEYSSTCPIGYIGPGGQTDGGRYANCTGGAAAWLDRLILGENHLYNDNEVKEIFKTKVTHDPEGILGYTTSVLLTLIGLQCGKILVRFKSHKTRLMLFSQWFAMLTAACILVIIIPINKRLWSLTFITLTGATSFLIITLLYLLIEVYSCERTFILRLLTSAGRNSIFLYVGHSLLSDMLPWYFVVDKTSHLQLLLRLAWSTFVWLLIAHYMALKNLFIKL